MPEPTNAAPAEKRTGFATPTIVLTLLLIGGAILLFLSWRAFLFTGAGLAALGAASTVGVLIMEMISGPKQRLFEGPRDIVSRVAWQLPALFVMGVGAAGWFAVAKMGILWLADWVQAPGTKQQTALLVCVPLTLVIGIVFFLARLKLRLAYGLVEVGVGLLIAWQQVKKYSGTTPVDDQFFLAFLTAAVYLVVRGFDNMHHGWTHPGSDPFSRYMQRKWAASRERPKATT